ncbi:ATP-binding protein [Azospirillum himalayense]|uniref:histidine kinase n=1 Tax=Azospirillum himalayense TaxID=654847 RepID=A0ABW0G3T3_9PROT
MTVRKAAPLMEERALVLAPNGRNAALAQRLLGDGGIEAVACSDLDALVRELARGAGVAVLVEEALVTADLHRLSAWIAAQPPWSDFPFVLLTGRTGGLERNPAAGRLMEILGNVAFLERPFHPTTLIGAVRGALRARRRQYQARAYAMERAEAAERLRVAHSHLLASEQRLRMILESATNYAIVTTDLDGRITVWNTGARNILGWEEEEILGQSMAVFFTPEDRADGRPQEEMHRALTEGRVSDERWHMRKDGSRFWAMGMMMPLRDGDVHGFLRILRDRTEERQVEEALRLAKEEAERANAAKSRFLATASHDLRQPLQSLLLFLESLKPHVKDTEGKKKLVHLGRGLDAMKALLDGLLDISRLDAGAVAPAFEDFPLQPLIDQLAASYVPVAAIKGLALRVSPCGGTVRSDPTLLGRMVRNLLENAVRYTENGEIALDCRREGGALRILVRDTGVGIPADHLDRIWEEFHQVGNTERDRNQGLGLGLAIVQRLSMLLDHSVEVRSVPGEGSTFSIMVPLGGAALVRPSVHSRAASGGGRFAVVVDDDAIVLMGLQAILTEWGYEVLVAGSIEEVLERLRAGGRRPDIVITDYRLREQRFGTEGVVEIRRLLGADIPGILLTGETGPECAREAEALNLAMLYKPVTPRQLGDLMEQQMDAM